MTVPPTPAEPVLDAVVLAGGRARRLDGAAKPHVQLDGRALLAHVLDGLAGSRLVRRVAVVGPPDVAVPSPLPLVQVQEDPPFGGPVAGIAAGLAVLDGVEPARVGAASMTPSGAGSDTAPSETTHADAGPCPRADAAPSVGSAGDLVAHAATSVGSAGDLVGVVACDVPGGARMLPALVHALQETPGADGACARADGRDQWLLGVYRRAALAEALAALTAERGSLTGASVRALVGGFELVRVDDVSGASADVDTWADLDALSGGADQQR